MQRKGEGGGGRRGERGKTLLKRQVSQSVRKTKKLPPKVYFEGRWQRVYLRHCGQHITVNCGAVEFKVVSTTLNKVNWIASHN